MMPVIVMTILADTMQALRASQRASSKADNFLVYNNASSQFEEELAC